MLRWYLICTKPLAESCAQSNLERQGYEVYLPRLAQSALRRGRWREAIVALFPGYLFLRLSEGEQALAPVRSTVGVSQVVRFGARYAIVPDDIVRELRARADPVTGLHRTVSEPFVAGAPVKIAAGPFDGLQGVFCRKAGADRVLVLLSLLGHDSAVRVPAGFVVPAHAA